MNGQKIKNVLFLCTGNSARSILAEALINQMGAGRFRGFSAGSYPTGSPNPFALKLLQNQGHPLAGLRSKSWDEFAGEEAPELHFIFTVCDNAAGEVCPIWPGRPVSAHWGLPDPAGVTGSDEDIMAAFEETYARLHKRLSAFLELPFDQLDEKDLKQRLDQIAQNKLV